MGTKALVMKTLCIGGEDYDEPFSYEVQRYEENEDGSLKTDGDGNPIPKTETVTEMVTKTRPTYAYPGDIIDVSHFGDLQAWINTGTLILQPAGQAEAAEEAKQIVKDAKEEADKLLAEVRADLETQRAAMAADREALNQQMEDHKAAVTAAAEASTAATDATATEGSDTPEEAKAMDTADQTPAAEAKSSTSKTSKTTK